MKDSQHHKSAMKLANKYIKANNERFSTIQARVLGVD